MKAHLVFVIISLSRGEHQEVGLDLPGENFLGGLVVEINHQWQRLRTDELGDIFLGELKNI